MKKSIPGSYKVGFRCIPSMSVLYHASVGFISRKCRFYINEMTWVNTDRHAEYPELRSRASWATRNLDAKKFCGARRLKIHGENAAEVATDSNRSRLQLSLEACMDKQDRPR